MDAFDGTRDDSENKFTHHDLTVVTEKSSSRFAGSATPTYSGQTAMLSCAKLVVSIFSLYPIRFRLVE